MDAGRDAEIVELGECDSEQELLVVRSLLESSGIPCSGPLLSSGYKRGIGGLKVYVRKEDLEAARAVLDSTPASEPDASDEPLR